MYLKKNDEGEYIVENVMKPKISMKDAADTFTKRLDYGLAVGIEGLIKAYINKTIQASKNEGLTGMFADDVWSPETISKDVEKELQKMIDIIKSIKKTHGLKYFKFHMKK